MSNLLQTLLESLLFYHPAIWWISGVVRAERENCCDDLVVAVSGNVPEYAAALAALEENRRAGYRMALAANGGSLVKRVHRLLHPRERQRLFLSPLVIAGAVAVGAACLSFGWQTRPSAPLAVTPPVAAAPLVTLAQVLPPPAVQPQQRSPAAVSPRIETPWRKWLNEDVAYIISDEERQAFLAIGSSHELEKFVEQFWLRRDPTPGTPVNEMKEEHYRRIAYVNDRFSAAGIPGWKTDRGRIYIMFGPADELESHPSGGLRSLKDGGGSVFTVPFEQWRYRHLEGIGDDVIIEFVDRAGTGEYRMTRNPNEKVR